MSLKLGCIEFNPFVAEFRHNATAIEGIKGQLKGFMKGISQDLKVVQSEA